MIRVFKINNIFLVFLLLFTSCINSEVSDEYKQEVYFCNAENCTDDRKFFIDKFNKQILFSNAQSQSKTKAYSGEYSILLDTNNKYGFSTYLKHVEADEFFKITVWRKSETKKGVISASTNGFYRASGDVIESAQDGWEKLELSFFAPPNIREGLKIYVWNNSEKSVFFDDFRIERSKEKKYPEFDILTSLKVYYTEKANQKIQQIRRNSFDYGNIIISESDYIGSIIFSEDNFIEAKIRIKGDWLDHIQGDKISFRIKAKSDYSWKGMKTFSIQTPEARNFQHEWVLHKMLLNDDLLTTRYGFTPTYINNLSRGIYAWEEHFDKQLIESNNRREGPIIKFDESIFWNTVRLNKTEEFGYNVPYFEAAKITAFKSGRLLKSPLLLKEFLEAQSLLHQLQTNKTDISDIFDIQKYADFIAYNLLNEAYHGLAWHNIRFYYNPVLCKLEPITYDGGYREEAVFDDNILIAANSINTNQPIPRCSTHIFSPLKDTIYLNSLYKSLEKISNENFVKSHFSNFENELKQDEKNLQKEFTRYNYSSDHIYRNSERYRKLLKKIKGNISSNDFIENSRKIKFSDIIHLDKLHDDLNTQMVQIFQHENSENKQLVQIKNFTSDTIQLISGINKGDIFDTKFDSAYSVPPANNFGEAINIEIPEFFDSYYVLFPSINKFENIQAIKWQAPELKSSRQIIEELVQFPQNEFYSIFNDQIIFKDSVTVDKHIIIPKGFEVIIQSGTKINIIDSSTFVCYSPIFCKGDKNNPVLITSSDKSAKGFNVFQAEKKSKLQFTIFENISNLNFRGWITPTAVCFYESDVDMTNVTFSKNIACDDALNIVRSNFNVDYCSFIETNSDAFDSDFCTGSLTNSKFYHPGNDAIDFSGSIVHISDCEIESAGDKGVSGGEGSTLFVTNTTINNSNIGIASKDRSVVEVKNSIVSNCVYGLSAYIKKAEYGSANLKIDNVKFKNNILLHLIEEHSTLTINNKTINGSARNLAERFY